MKLKPGEAIPGSKGVTVGDFWSWAYSDILSNRNRAVFAEFLVGSALGLTDQPRREWDMVDFRYNGQGIEVKSAAYLQSWQQEQLSTIRFDIAKKQAWDAATNEYFDEIKRWAACYVFCLYPETDANKANILDVEAWLFYVLPTLRIEQEFGYQKSVGLKAVHAICDPISYANLKAGVDAIMGF